MFTMLPVLAYFSPETMLPLSSLIATIVGFCLLIKRSSIRFVVHCFRAAFQRQGSRPSVGGPHFNRSTSEVKDQARS
jgi:hypothetical protein